MKNLHFSRLLLILATLLFTFSCVKKGYDEMHPPKSTGAIEILRANVLPEKIAFDVNTTQLRVFKNTLNATVIIYILHIPKDYYFSSLEYFDMNDNPLQPLMLQYYGLRSISFNLNLYNRPSVPHKVHYKLWGTENEKRSFDIWLSFPD